MCAHIFFFFSKFFFHPSSSSSLPTLFLGWNACFVFVLELLFFFEGGGGGRRGGGGDGKAQPPKIQDREFFFLFVIPHPVHTHFYHSRGGGRLLATGPENPPPLSSFSSTCRQPRTSSNILVDRLLMAQELKDSSPAVAHATSTLKSSIIGVRSLHLLHSFPFAPFFFSLFVASIGCAFAKFGIEYSLLLPFIPCLDGYSR